MDKKIQINGLELKVLNLIKNYGTFEKPIPQKRVMEITGQSKRTIEHIIERLRCKFGHPIVTRKNQPNGYFLPRNENERVLGLAPYKEQISTSSDVVAIIEAIDLDKYWSRL